VEQAITCSNVVGYKNYAGQEDAIFYQAIQISNRIIKVGCKFLARDYGYKISILSLNFHKVRLSAPDIPKIIVDNCSLAAYVLKVTIKKTS